MSRSNCCNVFPHFRENMRKAKHISWKSAKITTKFEKNNLITLQSVIAVNFFQFLPEYDYLGDQYTESGQTLQDVACVRSREMAVLNKFRGRGTFFDAESAWSSSSARWRALAFTPPAGGVRGPSPAFWPRSGKIFFEGPFSLMKIAFQVFFFWPALGKKIVHFSGDSERL